MPVIEISSLTHPGVEIFSTLTEAQLRNRFEPDKGLFIAESPKVIKVALDVGYEPLALLCEHKHIYGDAAEIIERCGDIPVYTSGRELLAELTGYAFDTWCSLCHAPSGSEEYGGRLPGSPAYCGYRRGGGYHQYWGHLPFGGSSWHGCCAVDA